MRQVVLTAFVLALFAISIEASPSENSPYAGQEVRVIKALSESDIAGLLAGKGMGYAKAAELNGYPGPRHVLDLSEELGLSTKQRAQTQEIFDQMQASAKELGVELVAAERALDELFKNNVIDRPSLSKIMTKIGRIEARLREVHLDAHLDQTEILSTQQVANYMKLRGYEHAGHEHRH